MHGRSTIASLAMLFILTTGLSGAFAEEITMQWRANTDQVDGYIVSYADNENNAQADQFDNSQTVADPAVVNGQVQHTLSLDLGSGQHYWFALQAYRDEDGNRLISDYSTLVSTRDNAPPSIPDGLAAEAGECTAIKLTWNAAKTFGNSPLDGYHIYRNDKGDNPVGETLTNMSNPTSFTDETCASGTDYTYTVAAFTANDVESLKSESIVHKSGNDNQNPTMSDKSLVLETKQAKRVTFHWSAANDECHLAGYHVYRDDSRITTEPLASTSYADTTVSAQKTYKYFVRAYDAAGNHVQSGDLTVETPQEGDSGNGSGGGGGGGCFINTLR